MTFLRHWHLIDDILTDVIFDGIVTDYWWRCLLLTRPMPSWWPDTVRHGSVSYSQWPAQRRWPFITFWWPVLLTLLTGRDDPIDDDDTLCDDAHCRRDAAVTLLTLTVMRRTNVGIVAIGDPEADLHTFNAVQCFREWLTVMMTVMMMPDDLLMPTIVFWPRLRPLVPLLIGALELLLPNTLVVLHCCRTADLVARWNIVDTMILLPFPVEFHFISQVTTVLTIHLLEATCCGGGKLTFNMTMMTTLCITLFAFIVAMSIDVTDCAVMPCSILVIYCEHLLLFVTIPSWRCITHCDLHLFITDGVYDYYWNIVPYPVMYWWLLLWLGQILLTRQMILILVLKERNDQWTVVLSNVWLMKRNWREC